MRRPRSPWHQPNMRIKTENEFIINCGILWRHIFETWANRFDAPRRAELEYSPKGGVIRMIKKMQDWKRKKRLMAGDRGVHCSPHLANPGRGRREGPFGVDDAMQPAASPPWPSSCTTTPRIGCPCGAMEMNTDYSIWEENWSEIHHYTIQIVNMKRSGWPGTSGEEVESHKIPKSHCTAAGAHSPILFHRHFSKLPIFQINVLHSSSYLSPTTRRFINSINVIICKLLDTSKIWQITIKNDDFRIKFYNTSIFNLNIL